MKGGEQFHVSKDQYWREPDVTKLWREHLYHMKRQQMPETDSLSVTESDMDWEDVDDDSVGPDRNAQNQEINIEMIGKQLNV